MEVKSYEDILFNMRQQMQEKQMEVTEGMHTIKSFVSVHQGAIEQ